MAAANITGSLFNIIIFIYLARTLAPESFGYLSYAFALIFYLANFIDLGLSTYGIREIAKDNKVASLFVSEIGTLRLAVATILYVAVTLFAFLIPQPDMVKFLIAEACLMFFISALATEWAYQGLEKMYMVFISFFATSIIQLLLLLAFVKGPLDVVKVPIIYFFGSCPVIAVFLWRLRFSLKMREMDLIKIASYLKSSAILWSISMLAQVYNNLDILMLALFRKPEEVGYFTIARRFVGAVTFLLIFLANALLPRLAHTFSMKEVDNFNSATKRFVRISIVLIAFFFAPVMVLSRQLVTITVGSEYLPAMEPMSIMVGGLILILFNLPYSTGLIAASMEKEVLKQVAASAALNICLNLVLIPKYGMIGASVSFFFSEALALIWILWVYKHKLMTCINCKK